jgi:hypothetical protein
MDMRFWWVRDRVRKANSNPVGTWFNKAITSLRRFALPPQLMRPGSLANNMHELECGVLISFGCTRDWITIPF